MKWLLIVVIVFSLLTVFELYKEHKKGTVSKNLYIMIAALEGIAAVIACVLLFVL